MPFWLQTDNLVVAVVGIPRLIINVMQSRSEIQRQRWEIKSVNCFKIDCCHFVLSAYKSNAQIWVFSFEASDYEVISAVSNWFLEQLSKCNGRLN